MNARPDPHGPPWSPNINAVLQKLGITTGSAPFHQNHFHIYLKPPTIQLLPSTPQQLNTAIDHMDDKFDSGTQTVDGLDQIKADKLLFEEEIMFALDVPAIAIPSESVAIVAQVDSSKAKPISFDYLLKDCWETQPTPNDPTSAVRGGSAASLLRNYYQSYGKKVDTSLIKVALLETAKNGDLQFEQVEEQGKFSSGFLYFPKPGYLGKDRAVFAAEYGGKRYKVVLDIVVSQAIVETGPPTCPEPQLIRLQRPIKTSGSDITDPILTNDLAAWQRSADLSALIASAQQTLAGFTDLPGTALGQTTGEGASAAITLDQNAAGHGWYIDPTPLNNTDDYLPTSNPEIWQAKAGSAAAGKMDMLSVLLHEYGHALGLEHSADSSNYMAASLQPGQRKLPSAAELTLMARMVAELKGADGEALTLALSQGERGQDNPFAPSPLSVLGLLPFGFMRSNGNGSANAAHTASAALHTDYLTAINTTLANGSFNARQNASIDQWESVGNVAATPANASQAVTLGESTTAQAHLGQAFILTAQDRFLTFTVSGLNLQTNSIEQNGVFTTAPQDAFEVALQNANTGANLLANGAGGVGNYPF